MADLIRVLYVDDEPYLLDIGKIFLEKLGDFSVTTIDSAASAFELISKEKFDAIISDYQMPEMDGITFLKRLKNLEIIHPSSFLRGGDVKRLQLMHSTTAPIFIFRKAESQRLSSLNLFTRSDRQ